MELILKSFNSRELAILTWIIVFAIYILLSTKKLKTCFSIVSFLKFYILYCFVAVYLLVMLFILYKLSFWDIKMLKTTIVWSMSCFIGIFYIQDALKEKNYFWKILKKILYPTIFLGHILNEHTFCYGIELLTMIPLFIFIFIEISISKMKKKWILSIMLIGSVLIMTFFSNSIFYIFKHPNVYLTIDYLKSLFLITILSIFFMPFQYLFAVYLAYDSFLTNTNYVLEENPELYSYIRKYVLLKCMINFEKINKINSQLHVYTTINEEIAKREIDQILKKDEQL